VTRSLVIVESPAKAKTLKKFLGRSYIVRASMGHVRDLPKSQLGVDVQHGFQPKYITIRGKGKVLEELRKEARKADRILLATDPDREGEAISWHLVQALKLNGDEPCRIEFHEITRDAVRNAVKNPRPVDENLVDAQQARRILDRLVGYKLSPLLWRKVRRGLSAGRVQSVAVRLICDREEEIESFEPEEYWSITAKLCPRGQKTEAFEAKYYGSANGEKRELKTGDEAQAVIEAARREGFVVRGVRKKERRRNPAPPFTTSTLQQEASRKLGFRVSRTMRAAQQLYEGLDIGAEGTVGLVTYIRTDSTRVSDEAVGQAASFVREQYGQSYVQPRKWGKVREGVQGAHEAIRPTSVARTPEAVRAHLTADQYKLYKLIWERFLASQMASAVLDTVSVDIQAGGHLFRATGSRVKFPGFTTVYTEGKDERADEREGHLPELRKGDILDLLDLKPHQHFTQPPPRYTEAMLVKALEEKGIGRPSTYAPTIETIQQRGYVTRENNRFVPTALGKVVVDLLKRYFPDIIDVEFTAEMEKRLDLIEEGKEDWRKLLYDFYGPFEATLARAEEQIARIEVAEEQTDVECEKCGRLMVVKWGKYGKFLACPGFPECRNTKPYFERTGVRCPECGEGEVVKRRSKKGRTFYGCNRYPDCEFVSWQRPTGERCPECGTYLVERRSKRGTYLLCAAKDCSYRARGDKQ